MIDKRVIERQIRKGKLDAAAFKRTLEALPDVSDRVARDADGEPSRSAANSVSSVSSVQVRAPEVSAVAPDEVLGDEEEDDEDDEDEDDDDDEEEESAPEDATTSS